jgi:hypothetical protein
VDEAAEPVVAMDVAVVDVHAQDAVEVAGG